MACELGTLLMVTLSDKFRLLELIGLALPPWDVLCGGRLRTDAEEARCET